VILGSWYIDPIYLVLLIILAVFGTLLNVVLFMRSMIRLLKTQHVELKQIRKHNFDFLEVMKGIYREAERTRQNTEPMQKLRDNLLLLEYHTPVIPSDETQRIPRITSQRASRQLYLDSTHESPTESIDTVDTR